MVRGGPPLKAFAFSVTLKIFVSESFFLNLKK
jgi:hypothetical protein